MKLFVTFTIFMGVLAGLLLANSCDDVNHLKLPGGARKDDFQSKADFKEELKNYRKSSCEKLRNRNCHWTEESGGVCERFVSQNRIENRKTGGLPGLKGK